VCNQVLVWNGLGREGVGGGCSFCNVAVSCCDGAVWVVHVEFGIVSVALGLGCHAGADIGAFGANRPKRVALITEQYSMHQ
jgi:hypothetical protein